MHNFLCKNVWIFPLYIFLTGGINTFWFKGINKFWGEAIETFWVQKITEEKTKKFTKIFELYQVFICPKIFAYLQIINCQHALKSFLPFMPTFPTTLPQLCQLFTISHQLHTKLYLEKLVLFLFLIFWHLLLFFSPIPPSCWMPCYRH